MDGSYVVTGLSWADISSSPSLFIECEIVKSKVMCFDMREEGIHLVFSMGTAQGCLHTTGKLTTFECHFQLIGPDEMVARSTPPCPTWGHFVGQFFFQTFFMSIPTVFRLLQHYQRIANFWWFLTKRWSFQLKNLISWHFQTVILVVSPLM